VQDLAQRAARPKAAKVERRALTIGALFVGLASTLLLYYGMQVDSLDTLRIRRNVDRGTQIDGEGEPRPNGRELCFCRLDYLVEGQDFVGKEIAVAGYALVASAIPKRERRPTPLVMENFHALGLIMGTLGIFALSARPKQEIAAYLEAAVHLISPMGRSWRSGGRRAPAVRSDARESNRNGRLRARPAGQL
jgi:hypothetical protein